MDTVVTALHQQHAELERLVAPLDPDGWARPSPDCPGWSVADLVLHLAQTDELAMAGPTEGHAVAATRLAGGPPAPGETTDDTVGRMVAHERGGPPADVLARWRESSAALRAFFLAHGPRDPLPWIFGDLPARTLATTRVVECWIHTRDVAHTLGTTTRDGAQLWHVARLAWRTLPYACTRAGRPAIAPEAVRLVLTAPDGSEWAFGPEDASTVITGSALEFCLVAARRVDPTTTGLVGDGPDAEPVLALVRTWA
jgi:uncharacterized protein (TIGR03084 family)